MKVIFLDMDGVLVPFTQKRFDYIKHKEEPVELHEKLYKEFGIDYSQYDKYDLGAAYYDVNEDAVKELQRIIDETGAKIVVSSDWRTFRPENMMKDLLTIHGLGEYVVGITPHDWDNNIDRNQFKDIFGKELRGRELEIHDYLKKHKEEITNYVVIDDIELTKYFKNHFVRTFPKLSKEDADKAIEILNNE